MPLSAYVQKIKDLNHEDALDALVVLMRRKHYVALLALSAGVILGLLLARLG